MIPSLDPIHRLVNQEALRFVGTIGEPYTDASSIYLSIVEQFEYREVRALTELTEAIRGAREKCTMSVAKTAVEVAAALGILTPLFGGVGAQTKYVLADNGLVLRGMRKHPRWSDSERRKFLMFRPMFERHGDYLVQCLSAIQISVGNEEPVLAFRKLVREAVDKKMSELPTSFSGAKWDAYRAGIATRRASIFGAEAAAHRKKVTLEDMQRARKKSEKALFARSKVGSAAIQRNDGETKTLDHQFARCMGWLLSLNLARTEGRSRYELTAKGSTLLSFLQNELNGASPLTLPPSEALISDCFRLSREQISEIWGAIIDDSFWERAMLAMENSGEYMPSNAEIIMRFDQAFESVRVPQISEASLTPLRQVLFLSWLWEGKPVSSSVIDSIVAGENSVPRQYPEKFGYGRNRQGRIAYLFRKGVR